MCHCVAKTTHMQPFSETLPLLLLPPLPPMGCRDTFWPSVRTFSRDGRGTERPIHRKERSLGPGQKGPHGRRRASGSSNSAQSSSSRPTYHKRVASARSGRSPRHRFDRLDVDNRRARKGEGSLVLAPVPRAATPVFDIRLSLRHHVEHF